MKNSFPLLAILFLAVAGFVIGEGFADPVQLQPQPPTSLPPSALPPGSPAPTEPPSVSVGKKKEVRGSEVDEFDRVEEVRKLTANSTSFANAAAQEGVLEVEAGRLAASKGSSVQVREFGKHLAMDHEKLNSELKKVAKANNLVISSELDGEHRAKLEVLKAKEGPQFDSTFAEMMAKGHERAEKLFREASTAAGVNGDLQSFAKRTLPTLQEHTSTAKQLHAGLAALSRN